MRLFAAIALPDAVKQALAQRQQSLRAALPGVGWTSPDQWHITLKFFGEIEEGKVPGLAQALQAASQTTARFSLALGGLGAFPSSQRPRVIWAGLSSGEAALLALARRIEDLTVAAGFAPADKPFQAHITLGRVRQSVPGMRLPSVGRSTWPAGLSWPVEGVGLYLSELLARGARHTRLEHFVLQEG